MLTDVTAAFQLSVIWNHIEYKLYMVNYELIIIIIHYND